MQKYLYENDLNEQSLCSVLLEIGRYLVKEDIFSPYMERDTFLYNHPALNELSQYAIKTPSFNFINADYFHELSILPNKWANKIEEIKELHAILLTKLIDKEKEDERLIRKLEKYQGEIKEVINNLDNIKIFTNIACDESANFLTDFNLKNPIAKISNEKLLEILHSNKIESYDMVKNQIEKTKSDTILFPLEERNFILDFKQKRLPEFIKILNQLIKNNEKEEALHLSEYFAASVSQESSELNNLGFAVFARTLFDNNFKFYIIESMVKVLGSTKVMVDSKRNFLIEESSGSANLPDQILSNLTIRKSHPHKYGY